MIVMLRLGMFRRGVSLAGLLWLASMGQGGTPAIAETRLVRVEGRSFVAPDGQRIGIKGISLGNWLVPEGYMWKFEVAKAPHQIYAAFDRLLGRERAAAFWTTFRDRYVTREDIRFIKAAGFNTVRIPLHYRLFIDDRGTVGGPGWALLDRLLGWMREEGLRAIPDLHAAPGGQTGVNHDDGSGYPLTFYVPRHRSLTVAFWRAVAERYAGDPVILGYDLLNEPIAPYHDVATLNPRLEPFYREITAAIRAVDPQRVVILAGAQWSSSFHMLGPPFTDNLAYTYHSFWSSTKRDAIQRHLNFANLHDVPLFLGETGELTDEWNQGFRTLHETHGVGWSFWAYKNLESGSTVVSVPLPPGWPDIVAFVDGRTKTPPDPAVVDRALAAYLDGLDIGRATIRWSYLGSLGLKSAP
jgi:aryl-phospho-beta-D-glucosidase BglC (GH1 family)